MVRRGVGPWWIPHAASDNMARKSLTGLSWFGYRRRQQHQRRTDTLSQAAGVRAYKGNYRFRD
ncbi:hypothetical protein GE21DRAFT_1353003, partial [Neurospora crassa]